MALRRPRVVHDRPGLNEFNYNPAGRKKAEELDAIRPPEYRTHHESAGVAAKRLPRHQTGVTGQLPPLPAALSPMSRSTTATGTTQPSLPPLPSSTPNPTRLESLRTSPYMFYHGETAEYNDAVRAREQQHRAWLRSKMEHNLAQQHQTATAAISPAASAPPPPTNARRASRRRSSLTTFADVIGLNNNNSSATLNSSTKGSGAKGASVKAPVALPPVMPSLVTSLSEAPPILPPDPPPLLKDNAFDDLNTDAFSGGSVLRTAMTVKSRARRHAVAKARNAITANDGTATEAAVLAPIRRALLRSVNWDAADANPTGSRQASPNATPRRGGNSAGGVSPRTVHNYATTGSPRRGSVSPRAAAAGAGTRVTFTSTGGGGSNAPNHRNRARSVTGSVVSDRTPDPTPNQQALQLWSDEDLVIQTGWFSAELQNAFDLVNEPLLTLMLRDISQLPIQPIAPYPDPKASMRRLSSPSAGTPRSARRGSVGSDTAGGGTVNDSFAALASNLPAAPALPPEGPPLTFYFRQLYPVLQEFLTGPRRQATARACFSLFDFRNCETINAAMVRELRGRPEADLPLGVTFENVKAMMDLFLTASPRPRTMTVSEFIPQFLESPALVGAFLPHVFRVILNETSGHTMASLLKLGRAATSSTTPLHNTMHNPSHATLSTSWATADGVGEPGVFTGTETVSFAPSSSVRGSPPRGGQRSSTTSFAAS